MDIINVVNVINGAGPGLGSFGPALPGPGAAQRCCASGDAAGVSADPLAALMEAQTRLMGRMLKLLVKLMKGKKAGKAGKARTADSAGGGASSPSTSSADKAAGGAASSGPLPAEAGKWLTGDTQGMNPSLAGKLAQVAQKIGKKINVVSGFRSRGEQEALYQKYLNGTGNLAAKPGTSRHESGNAADVQVDGQSLGSNPQARAAALAVGLKFPVPGEPWHIEVA